MEGVAEVVTLADALEVKPAAFRIARLRRSTCPSLGAGKTEEDHRRTPERLSFRSVGHTKMYYWRSLRQERHARDRHRTVPPMPCRLRPARNRLPGSAGATRFRAASASTSSGSTRLACGATSGMAAAREATIGLPAAMASSSTMPKPSCTLGRQKTSARVYSAASSAARHRPAR